MRIVAFILESEAITAILAHLRKLERDPSALPEHLTVHAGRPPPLDDFDSQPGSELDSEPAESQEPLEPDMPLDSVELEPDADAHDFEPDFEPDSVGAIDTHWE